MSGVGPLYAADEGTPITVVSADPAGRAVARMKENLYGRGACVSGEVKLAAGGYRFG